MKRHSRINITIDYAALSAFDMKLARFTDYNRSRAIEILMTAYTRSDVSWPEQINSQNRKDTHDQEPPKADPEMQQLLDDIKLVGAQQRVALENLARLYAKCRAKYPKNAERMMELALSGNYNPS
jgi:hypothetical protein